MLLVRKVEGPQTVEAGDSVTYRATEFNQVNPDETERAGINWLVESDGEVLRRDEGAGDSLTIEVDDNLIGKTLVAMPYANSPTRTVSAVTLVRPGPDRLLRDGLAGIRHEFADILVEQGQELTDSQLAGRLKQLKFSLDDLLDSAGPLGLDSEGDIEEQPENEAKEKRLAIIVGHSERSSGARALPPIDQSEYPFNTEVARLMELAAIDRGVEARTIFRDNVGIEGAYRAATAFQPQAIIELHFNAASAGARGSETLCCELNSHSTRLAQEVQQAMVRVFNRTGRQDRGIKVLTDGDRGYGNVSAAPTIPSVLVEPFFGSNEDECRMAHQRMGAYAERLVEAFDDFVAGS